MTLACWLISTLVGNPPRAVRASPGPGPRRLPGAVRVSPGPGRVQLDPRGEEVEMEGMSGRERGEEGCPLTVHLLAVCLRSEGAMGDACIPPGRSLAPGPGSLVRLPLATSPPLGHRWLKSRTRPPGKGPNARNVLVVQLGPMTQRKD